MDQQLEGRRDKRYDSQVNSTLYIVCMLVDAAKGWSTTKYSNIHSVLDTLCMIKVSKFVYGPDQCAVLYKPTQRALLWAKSKAFCMLCVDSSLSSYTRHSTPCMVQSPLQPSMAASACMRPSKVDWGVSQPLQFNQSRCFNLQD